jgi:hypothetical protein
MHAYEIRILRNCISPSLIWASPHPSTYSALCKAREFAAHGDTIEVWRDTECIHREVISNSPK